MVLQAIALAFILCMGSTAASALEQRNDVSYLRGPYNGAFFDRENFILDYVREQKREKHQDAIIVEAGFRRQLTPFTLVTIGAGAGIGDDSEKYRVTVGFQHSF